MKVAKIIIGIILLLVAAYLYLYVSDLAYKWYIVAVLAVVGLVLLIMGLVKKEGGSAPPAGNVPRPMDNNPQV